MISEDLANMADRISGYALHGTAPPRDELGLIAAELLKFSRIVRTMEDLPPDRTLRFWPADKWMAHSYGTKDPDKQR